MEDPKIESTKRNLNEWLSKEEQDKWRNEFISTTRKDYLETINSLEDFNDLSSKEKDIAPTLLARFSFGVGSVLRRFGYKNNVVRVPVQFVKNERVPRVAAAVVTSEKGRERNLGIFMNPDWLKDIVRLVEKGEFAEKMLEHFQNRRYNPFPDPGDFFEIGGVEEAAHYLLHQEKGEGYINNNDFQYHSYWSSDAEYRALMWKLSYTKRYFPDYYEKLQEEKPWADHWRWVTVLFNDSKKKWKNS